MRGLAFPPNADADRETSYEYGTPISNVDDIHIDPALSSAAIDPALMMESDGVNVLHVRWSRAYVQRDASCSYTRSWTNTYSFFSNSNTSRNKTTLNSN